MRKLFVAALTAIALLCPPSAIAQQQTAPYSGRGPNTLTFSMVAQNDTATIYLTGSSWASVYWTIATAGSGAITTEISLDGGTNWIPSAYSKNISAISANPGISPWTNNGPVAGTYETPLPGNCTAFRIRYQTAGTATAGTLSPGVAYVPGMVAATLFDANEGVIGTGLTTGVLDVSGWSSEQIWFVTPTTALWSFNSVDDAGVSLLPTIQTTAASPASLLLAPTAGGATGASLAASVTSSISWNGRRFKLTLPAGGTVSLGRAIVVARR